MLTRMEAQIAKLDWVDVDADDDEEQVEEKDQEPGTSQSTGPPPAPVFQSAIYSAPETVADSVSSPAFNLPPPCLSPISEKSAQSSPPSVSDQKDKMRTDAPPYVSYTADLPHPSAATMGTTAGTSAGAPLGIGQLKLEGPARYSGGRKPSVRAWLVEVERWMRLMRYPPADWVDIVATRLDGAASTWIERELQRARRQRRAAWPTWEAFTDAMARAFEPATVVEEARQQILNLRQTGRVAGYVQRFRELLYKIPEMTEEESYTLFVRGLKPEVKTSVGVNVPGGLEDAITWAQRVDLWQSREGAGQEEKAGKKKQKGKLSAVSGEPGPSAGGQVVVVQGAAPQNSGGQREKGGGKGKQKGKQRQRQQRGQGPPRCFICGEGHQMKDCPQWKQVLAVAKKKPQGNA